MSNITQYTNLITSQHRPKPNFMATVSSMLSHADDTTTCAAGMNDAFDIDQAVGAQLDILGQILGVSRIVPFQPTDGSSPVLSDINYYLVLKARIAQNMWDGTTPGIYSLFASLFPGSVYLILTDNQNMTCNVTVIGLSSALQQNLISNGYIIPRPEGVQYLYYYPTTKIFSYGMDNTIFGGYGDSNWVEPA